MNTVDSPAAFVGAIMGFLFGLWLISPTDAGPPLPAKEREAALEAALSDLEAKIGEAEQIIAASALMLSQIRERVTAAERELMAVRNAAARRAAGMTM